MTEADQRARVVAIARSWLRTPYEHHQKVRGAGADCATLLAAVFEEAGLVPPIDLPAYSPDWHLNQDYQLYLSVILQHCPESFGPPLPGDIVMWKFGRVLSHGAIVVEWPVIIHALVGCGVILDDAEKSARFVTRAGGEAGAGHPRERHFYSWWAPR